MAAVAVLQCQCVGALAKAERGHGCLGAACLGSPAAARSAHVERRAALDIGSGTTKLLVTDVDVMARRCVRHVLTREVPVLYGVDARRTNGGRLSEAVQAEGLSVLRSLLAEAAALQAQAIIGVATEIFRRAPNGAEYIARVRRELGLTVCVVDQSVEALLGFRTAGALTATPLHELVMWDCGGGSFQLVTAPDAGEAHLRMHLGAFGDAVVTAMLVEMQGRDFAAGASPNPVRLSEAQSLIDRLKERMPAAPLWLRDSEGVVAIGGRNSMFFLLADMLQRGAVDADLGLVRAGSDGCPESCQMTARAARAAVEAAAGGEEEELGRRWCWRPNSDPPSMVLPKLCLIVASMESFKLGSFRWTRTVGNCPGIATCDVAELGAVIEHD